MHPVVEVTLSWLLSGAKGRDEKSFYRSPAFKDLREPTIEITSTECGAGSLAEPAQLKKEHSHDGEGRFPGLQWTAPSAISGQVKEWLLVVEDPDAPLPNPIVHGIFAGIGSNMTNIEHSHLGVADESKSAVEGGFHYGVCRRPVVYLPPRPLMNHGPHRYFFEVVALSETLAKDVLESRPTREKIAEAVQGKVLAWGLWVGAYERKWQ
ncbi:hypothetical protein KVR01_004108 [Diaporthe batatas]|uniref:uncharacterized protein n=1 Tax=Diaporthe batatas TaxID=748121 RepID=UPI001D055369|nr:uncharacterized protein KVR01_004108 [Diaporthe batatas]KAG8165556.1 hypothetical protein KVR01_004108 [Diaporthe batatas]